MAGNNVFGWADPSFSTEKVYVLYIILNVHTYDGNVQELVLI